MGATAFSWGGGGGGGGVAQHDGYELTRGSKDIDGLTDWLIEKNLPSSPTKNIARKNQPGRFLAGTVVLYLYVATGSGMTQGVLFSSRKQNNNKEHSQHPGKAVVKFWWAETCISYELPGTRQHSRVDITCSASGAWRPVTPILDTYTGPVLPPRVEDGRCRNPLCYYYYYYYYYYSRHHS